VPVDPRLTVLAGVRVRLGAPGPRTRARVASPEPPPPGSVAGRVRSETGAAVPGARVVVDGPVRLEAPSRGDGRFELGGVPPGRYQLTARAQGYRALERSVTVDPGRRLELTLVVARDVPPGELRGYVQSFDGTPLAATLTIIETESEIQAGVDGRFGVALAPGSYTVRVSAPGYRDQVMMVTIDEGGVTIRNIDLERSPDR
jgi:uncharacterized membrane protein